MSFNNYSKSTRKSKSGGSGEFSRRGDDNCWGNMSRGSGPSKRRYTGDAPIGDLQPNFPDMGPFPEPANFISNETAIGGPHAQINDIVFVVPRNFPEVKLTLQDSCEILNVLQDELFRVCRSPDMAPSFEENKFIDGALRFTCSNLFSLQWLIKVVSMCPWTNPALEVRNLLSMPGFFCLGLVVSGSWLGDMEFLTVMEKQNPGLGAVRWRVTHRKVDHAGWRVLVATDKDGVDAVKARLGKLFWGLGTVKVVMLGGTDRNYPSGPVWKMYPDIPRVIGPNDPGNWPEDVDSVEGWEMALSAGQWIQ